MKIRSGTAVLLHANGQTNKTKLTVCFSQICERA